MASIEKRSGNWRAKVRQSGSPSLNKTFTKKSDAVRWAAEAERAIRMGIHASKDCILRELLTRYSEEVTPTKKSADREKSDRKWSVWGVLEREYEKGIKKSSDLL